MEAIKEYLKYFDDVNETFFNDVKPIVQHMQNCKCKCCGSNMFRDNRCAYCMSVSKDVEEQLKKLETLLGKYSDTIENLPFREKMIINNFLNLLTSMDTVKSELVEDFLKKYDYREKYNVVFEAALRNMKNMLIENVELSSQQLSIIESQLLFSKYRWAEVYKPYEKSQKNGENKYALLFLFFVKNAGTQKNQISYDAFRQLVINFTNAEITRTLGYDRGGLCEVINEPEKERNDNHFKTLAYHEYDKIVLSEEIIRNLYEGKNFNIIDTIAHELTHMKQYYYGFMYGNHFKDKILSMYLPDYYDTNYYRTSFEKEAYIQGYAGCYDLLKAININPDLAYQGVESSYLSYMINHFNDPVRIINGEERNIDDIFDEFISKRPDVFKEYDKKYKYLHLLYKVVDDTVVPKTMEEIQSEYEELKARGIKSYEEPIEELYQCFLKERGLSL